MTTIVTTSPGFGKYGRVTAEIAARGWTLVRSDDPAALAQADFLVAGLPQVDAVTLTHGPRLKAVLKHGVGTDNIDIPACTAAGLPVMHTPGANADAVAELAIGLMFALARNIPAGHASVTSGGWSRQIGTQLGGKTLGIVGYGNIGRRLAKLAQGIGMRVIATDPFATDADVPLLPLDDLLAQADYVSLHIFGGADNRALMNADTIARMKRGACLLNLARGEVTDLSAVAEALGSGQLGSVAIDAFDVEPPDTSHPIFSHPRAIFTPHSGADTYEALENCGLMVIEDIETLLAGRIPQRCLNAKDL